MGDAKLLNEYPHLERTSENGPVKHSLFNVFKILRPAVVLDEAHKAYGAKKREATEEFVRSVNRAGPEYGSLSYPRLPTGGSAACWWTSPALS